MRELLVKTGDPRSLDQTLNGFGGVVVQDDPVAGTYWQVEPNVYAVRSLRREGIGFLRFAIEKQGYGTIVGERDA